MAELAHEAGVINKDVDTQAMLADYSQPIRVTPTRFLVGVEMQSISLACLLEYEGNDKSCLQT